MTHKVRSQEEQAQSLANYLPSGKAFAGKNVNGSNIRKLLRGLAKELVRADEFIKTFESEMIPDETVLLIDQWEEAVGIPDSCFPGTGTITERRTHVLVKLASLGLQTKQDFIDLAAILGVTVTITQGADKYTINVNYSIPPVDSFPLTFPISFGDEVESIMQCLFNKLKPANCAITYINT